MSNPNLTRISVEQYHTLIDRGILRDGDPIELIDGLPVLKDRADLGGDPTSHGPLRTSGIRRLQRPFRGADRLGYFLHSQLPITLGSDQEPEPDLAIIRGFEADYDQRLPGPRDIAGVMEVAVSSLIFDRTTKQRLYATAEIPVYWIVNLVDMQVEVYQNPNPAEGIYATRTDYHPGQTVKFKLSPGAEIEVTVADLLPT